MAGFLQKNDRPVTLVQDMFPADNAHATSSPSNSRHMVTISGVILMAFLFALVGCGSLDNLIGQRPAGPTATAPLFATATPGGRISIMLLNTPDTVQGTAGPLPTGVGQLVAPAATATAAYATMQAGTATANAPLRLPTFQSGDCPAAAIPQPPAPPTSFSQYPEVIGRYLSVGGPTTVLESLLRSWKAFNDGAVIQSDTDLTGDNAPEIIVTLYDPAYYQHGQPAPGQLLVYGCAEKAYRLLYSTPYSQNTMIPILRRVGDMNGDFKSELAYTQQTCTNGQCTEAMQIMSWDSSLGAFKPLNNLPINTTNARIGISDIDGDGILEVTVVFYPLADYSAGPPRKQIDIWDWDGNNYRLAVTELEPPVYKIHAAHDGDYYFGQGDWQNAIKAYNRVRDDKNLQPWSAPNEDTILPAYVTLKKMYAQLMFRQVRAAAQSLTTLQNENPPGSPAEGVAQIGQTFMDVYRKNSNQKKACDAALAIAQNRPEVLNLLNSYGYGNRSYSLTDLCPLTGN